MFHSIKQRIVIGLTAISLLVAPVIAQETITEHTVSFDGVSLTYSTDFAEMVNINRYAGDAVEGAGLGFSDAKNFTFQLYNDFFPTLEGEFVANVSVYRMADIAQYEFMLPVVDELQTLIDTDADLTTLESLPHLPIYTHGQVIRAQAHYIENEQLAGIGYIAAVQAAAEPFLQNSFFYTVQAISADGEYYISAHFNDFTVPTFPAEIATDFDMDAFSQNLDSYLAQSTDALNALSASDFVPDFTVFDNLVLTLQFDQADIVQQ